VLDTHAQLVVAVLAAVVGSLVTTRRPTEVRIRWLAAFGLAFLVVVAGWWSLLLLALVLVTHGAVVSSRHWATPVTIGVLVAVLVAFKVRALVVGGLLGDRLFVPIGLSFLVFQLVAYLVDVRRERIEPAEGPTALVAFSLLPPIRMSGPVLRYRDFSRSTRLPFEGPTARRVLTGAALIGVGLLKKRVGSDLLLDHLDQGWPLADVDRLVRAAAELIALYFDASGFADIAVGCGVLLGIKVAASFSRPLTRGRSLTDFWRRWQMTVMGWFRDYVYAPLRGDGSSTRRAWFALAVSFFASAAWHGLHPVWFAWGLLTVGALTLDQRVAPYGGSDASPALAGLVRGGRRIAMYLYLFALTTLLLAADRQSFDGVRELFDGPLTVGRTASSLALLAVVVGALVAVDAWREARDRVPTWVNGALGAAGVVCLVWPGTVEPFVYQRF
jgi:D-alanyl-lipoteichoic acid acyltransferase DltB (MBOAT superfamily)